MSRTQGYYVQLWRQGNEGADEASSEEPQHLMDGDVPQLFMTAAEATEAGKAYTMERDELTYAIEPVVP